MEIIIPIEQLTLKQIVKHQDRYSSLIDDLANLPCPGEIRIGLKYFHVPQDINELTETICFGQRLFLAEKTHDDLETIIHTIIGYYYPYIFKYWDRDKTKKVLPKIYNCNAVELFPAGYQILKLTGELIEREKKLLYRKIKSEEIQAGIDKLNKYSDIASIDFLREKKHLINDNEIMLLPYSECLVRFMKEKEEQEYAERLREVYEAKSKIK
jgi:hypothetical protein